MHMYAGKFLNSVESSLKEIYAGLYLSKSTRLLLFFKIKRKELYPSLIYMILHTKDNWSEWNIITSGLVPFQSVSVPAVFRVAEGKWPVVKQRKYQGILIEQIVFLLPTG